MNSGNLYKILCDIKKLVLELGQLNWIDYVQLFLTILSGFMDAILFGIAIYTFYLTFISDKISIITFGESFGMWESDKINFIIKNHSLKSQIIKDVHVVFDNKYRLHWFACAPTDLSLLKVVEPEKQKELKWIDLNDASIAWTPKNQEALNKYKKQISNIQKAL